MCFNPGLNLLVTSEAEQNWHMLKTIVVILSYYCTVTKSSLGRIDLPNPKKLLGMLADIALTQVYSVTATTTTVVTGEEKNTEK